MKRDKRQPNERKRNRALDYLVFAVLFVLFALAMGVSLAAAQEAEASEELPATIAFGVALGNATRMRAMTSERRCKGP